VCCQSQGCCPRFVLMQSTSMLAIASHHQQSAINAI